MQKEIRIYDDVPEHPFSYKNNDFVSFSCNGNGVVKCNECKLRFKCYTLKWYVTIADPCLYYELRKMGSPRKIRECFNNWRMGT